MKQGESEKMKWIKYSVNGVTLFSQFLENAEIDGIPKPIEIIPNDSNSLHLIIPHFWNYAAIDPSMSR